VNYKPNRIKKADLTYREKAALQAVANGAIVEPLLCQRLKTRGLVERKRTGWRLTPQGQIRLLFQNAH
jgi:ribosomal protein S19E (S16A)